MTTLKPAGGMFICGDGGCDTTHYLRCTECGWTCVAPPPPDDGEDGQLTLDLHEQPVHTDMDCRRYQRENPKRTPASRTRAQQRAHNAYRRIHERHAPARMVRRHGMLTCPTCGFRP